MFPCNCHRKSWKYVYLFGHKHVSYIDYKHVQQTRQCHPCIRAENYGRIQQVPHQETWTYKTREIQETSIHTARAHRNNSVYMQSTTQTNKDSRNVTREPGTNPKCKACWPSQFMRCTHDSCSWYRSCRTQIHRDRIGTSLMFSLRSMLPAIASIFCSGATDDE
jgi:hypothetical protein